MGKKTVSNAFKSWCDEFVRQISCKVSLDEPLSAHTTFGVGGVAQLFAWLNREEELAESLKILNARKKPWRVLGKGSNLLVSDRGVSGAVLKLCGEMAGVKLLSTDKKKVVVEAGGGLALSRLINWVLSKGGVGLEGLWGIPATVGGAVKMNASAYGCEIKACLLEAHLVSRGRMYWVPARKLNMGYRTSVIGPKRIVTAARFKLTLKKPEQIMKR